MTTYSSPAIKLGSAICKAFGINADDVTGLTLTINVHELPTLTVEYVAIDVDAGAVETVLTAYEIKAKAVPDA